MHLIARSCCSALAVRLCSDIIFYNFEISIKNLFKVTVPAFALGFSVLFSGTCVTGWTFFSQCQNILV